MSKFVKIGAVICLMFIAVMLFAQAVTGTPQDPLSTTLLPFSADFGRDATGAWKMFKFSSDNIESSAVAQPDTLFNSETVSGANAPITVSIAGSSGTKVHLFDVNARCSAGTANITIKDGVGGTTKWSTATTAVGTADTTKSWGTPLASTTGNGMDIVLSACGTANTGTLDVHASRF
jgi:hypothetical protein